MIEKAGRETSKVQRVKACYLFVGSHQCALDVWIKFDRENRGGSAPKELVDSLTSGLAFLPSGLGNQNFVYAVEPRVGMSAGHLLEGKSAGLMAALHHRLAVAVASDSSLVDALSRVYASGELNGEEVRTVGQLHQKLELVLNAIDCAGVKGPFKFLVPAQASAERAWRARCQKSTCPVPQGRTACPDSIVTRRGVLEIVPVRTIKDAELAALGPAGTTSVERGLLRAARRTTRRLTALVLLGLVLICCLAGYLVWSRDLNRLERNFERLNSEKKWDALEDELRRIEGRPDASDMYNFYKGRVLVYRRRSATTRDATTHLNAIGPESRFFVRSQKTLVYYYGMLFGTGSKEFGDELAKAGDRLRSHGRSPLASYYSLAAEFVGRRRPTWPKMQEYAESFRRQYQDVFDFEQMKFNMRANVGEKIEFEPEFLMTLNAAVVFYSSASALVAKAEGRPIDAYRAAEDFEGLSASRMGFLRLSVGHVGLNDFDQLTSPIRSAREWAAAFVCRAGDALPVSFSIGDGDGDSVRVDLSVENGGDGIFEGPTTGILADGQGVFVTSFRTKKATSGRFLCTAADSRGGVTKSMRDFTVLPPRPANASASDGTRPQPLDIGSRTWPPLPTVVPGSK